MARLTGARRAKFVQGMFARIARRYDLMNRLMTAGQDRRWRRDVIQRAALPAEGNLLDIGAGTGDLAREAIGQKPDCHPVAADFTVEMMRVGRQRAVSSRLGWVAADAISLPFLSGIFDAVVSGFLLRNVSDVKGALLEQYRVLTSGGSIVILDTTRPSRNLLSPLINFHLHIVIPTLGHLVTGSREAYTYLPESTESFLEAEKLAALMVQTGFREVGFQRRMLGTIALHWGKK